MQALLLEQQDGKTLASVQTLDESRLPDQLAETLS